MVSFSPIYWQNKERKFLKEHPVAAPIASTVVVAGIGAGLGRILPIDSDLFIHHAKKTKADELLMELQKASLQGDTSKAANKLADIRILWGNEVFEKLINSDFKDEQITELGKSLTDLEVESRGKNIEKELLKDYERFAKKDPNILEKYKQSIKEMHASKSKTLATIVGLCTLVVTGLYSYYHSRSKKNKFL